MVFMADVPLIDAIRMITATPARILGISEKKGALVAGKDADIVLFDSSIEIEMTIIKGRVVYNRQAKIK
jgi:N-acetylglucosamine-6-phosphate deacetylase